MSPGTGRPARSSRSSSRAHAQSCVRIAECCGETPETIIAFEQLFYDMRSHLDIERTVLNKIQYSRQLPFTRIDLEDMIRSNVYWYGENMIEPTLRFYDETFYPSRIEGNADPTPHLTQRFAEKVEFYIWSIDPASSKGLLKLSMLQRRADLSMCRIGSGALFRPVLGSSTEEFRRQPPEPHHKSNPTAVSTIAGSSGRTLREEPEHTQPAPKIGCGG